MGKIVVSKNGRAYKIVKYFSCAVALYGLLGFLALPLVIEGQLKSFLEERLSISTSVEKIRFNPFALSLSVEGLDLHDADSMRFLSLGRLYINFQSSSLFRGAASFKEFYLDGMHVNFSRHADGGNNLEKIAAQWGATAEPVVSVEEEAASDSEIFPLIVEQFRVQQASFAFSDKVPAIPFSKYIDSINFSLQDFSTLPDQSATQSLTVAMGNGAKISWAGELSLSPLSSNGTLHLVGPYPELAYEYFRDQLPVSLTGGWFDASFDYLFELDSDSTPQVSLSRLNADLQTLSLRDKAQMSLLATVSNISLGGGEVRWPANTFSAQDLSLSGFNFYPHRDAMGKINFLELFPASSTTESENTSVSPVVEATPWQLALSELSLNDWHIVFVDDVPAQRFEIDLGVNVGLTNLSNENAAQIAVTTGLDIGGQGRADLNGVLQVLPEPAFSGALSLNDLALSMAQSYVAEFAHISMDDGLLSLMGDISYAADIAQFNGAMNLQSLLVADSVEQETLFSLVSLAIEDVRLGYDTELSVNVNAIRLEKPYVRVEVETDGSTNISRALVVRDTEDAEMAEASSESPGPEAALPLAVTVQRVSLVDGSADFADFNLPLPFAVAMRGLGGEVSALASRSSEPARVDIEGRVDEFGLATIQGELLPLAFQSLTDIDMSFRNLNMPAMTPYVIKFAGRHIDDGRMDVDLSYRIHDSQMQGENSLVLRDLELGRRQEHPGALDLPLGLALALLKNADGVIDLSVPVVGDLDNPQFQYGPVVSQALANIIRNIVASPFKLLAGLVGGSDEEEIGVISFVPGRSDLAPPEREKLLRLSDALAQRPQLALGLTGIFHVEADTAAIQTRRVDEKLQVLLDAGLEPGDNAMAQTSALESLYAAAEPQQAPEAFAAWRVARTPEAGAAGGFDELAYGGDIRRALIDLESVSEDDMSALGDQRAFAISAALADDLSGRVRVQPPTAVSAIENNLLSLELELIPL